MHVTLGRQQCQYSKATKWNLVHEMLRLLILHNRRFYRGSEAKGTGYITTDPLKADLSFSSSCASVLLVLVFFALKCYH